MNPEFSGNAQAMALVGFSAVATVTLLLCVMTGPDRDDLDEFYTGYGSLSPFRNGLAIAGDYISAATVLGTGGVIALFGYDGIVLALSTALSLMLLMFLLAEPLRNAGRFTMGDALTRRMPRERGIRVTASAVTLAALLPMMLVQLAGTGQLMAFILGFSGESLQTGCIIGVGALMISYAAIGGMKGTALIQILKMVMLLGSGTVVAALVLDRFDWNPGALFDAAADNSGVGSAFLSSGLQFAGGASPGLDMITSQLTVVLGGACLPHVTMRMYTASSARQVRRSMSWAVSSVALFVLVLTVVGFGATALVGRAAIAEADPRGNTAYLLGSQAAFGPEVTTTETFLLTTVTTAIFLTVLASVAGMILACANSLAHDVFASRLQELSPRREMTLARLSALAVGVPAILLATLVQHHSLQPLVTLSFCIGASAIAPALVYGLFWRRYTRTGLLATLIGGSLAVLLLMPGTNLVSGSPVSAFPGADFNWFPFTTTGLLSIPAGFACGWIGTMASGRAGTEEQRRQYEAVEARILAGAVRRRN
ncbi:sodium/solute symporter [Streptomyces griseomycini]|uniref:SSS family solute:Na+ symporter/cation/acetate symporter n=1 Tax=Streptomyces griseomycini TaxID=66895 RepID=A0A7W7PRS8_9ACTN|nr:cation acetate symporter [Streptomyces griseomycini]MBB4900079.1 SSS family solute:Na+ symporter/cation/acetate symporter [Streptomyces griseomycini]GGQ10970.1 cation acetate symporter [Streptomyces griseomycini]GGR27102.1 cation acetate symporter [Streptomyces griseomycini]